jgi:cytosine/adenosine deaminase-related metal-dependent hydrolase
VIRYSADWILPIADAVIRDGWVAVEDGRIAGFGAGTVDDVVDLGRVAILPALVNAHTHLELSYLHEGVPPSDRFIDWVGALMQARRAYPDPSDARIVSAAASAIRDARAAGTGLVGDVSNTLITVPLLRDAGLCARVFYEQLGFNVTDAAPRIAEARTRIADAVAPVLPDIRISLAPHAPYSVSPALFVAIRAELDAAGGDISTVHLGESPEEVEFVRRGSGPWRALLEQLGVWTDTWQAPGVSPVKYLHDLGFLDGRVLAVHGVQFEGEDLTALRSLGATIVSCPRSNRHVGVGAPPLEAFYAMNVAVAFGTDSLASAPDLNVFGELAEARRLAPRVPARQLLESATLVGARALGFARELGTIQEGKRAALIAVRVPDGVADVEEYLLGGIEARDVRWLDEAMPGVDDVARDAPQ